MDPLVSADEFAGYLQRDLDGYSAGLALAGASGLVRQFCDWPISQIEETFTLDGNGATVLGLPTLRLNAVDTVTVGNTEYTDYAWSDAGQLHRVGGWPVGFRNITAAVDHGYSVIPDEVRIVVCAIAARLYSNPEGLASKSSGDGGKSYVALTELEIRLISGHRLS